LEKNNIEHLRELSYYPELSNSIELELKPLQVSKFRKLVDEVVNDSDGLVEKDLPLIQQEKEASSLELKLQLKMESTAIEAINEYLSDDTACMESGAKNRLAISKSAHQNRAKRLRSLIQIDKRTYNAETEDSVQNYPQQRKVSLKKDLTWKSPLIEGESAREISYSHIKFIFYLMQQMLLALALMDMRPKSPN
jgi:hypothetical protein